MTEAVVDELEVVDVQQDHREVRASIAERVTEPLQEVDAIR